jgi:hypothetical protein
MLDVESFSAENMKEVRLYPEEWRVNWEGLVISRKWMLMLGSVLFKWI